MTDSKRRGRRRRRRVRRLREELERVCDALQVAADQIAIEGLIQASGAVLAGRQAIRVMATRFLAEVEEPAPPLHAVPEENAAG